MIKIETIKALFRISFFRKRVPIQLQTNSQNCGLACLAMIGQFYGRQVTTQELEKRFSAPKTGLSIRELTSIAEELRINLSSQKLEMCDIDKKILPAIVLLEKRHFVVLTHIGHRTCYINDPSFGKRQVPIEHFKQRYSGIVTYVQETPPRLTLFDLLSDVPKLRKAILASLGLAVAIQLFVTLSAFSIQVIVDDVIPNENADLLIAVIVGFGLIAALQTALSILRELYLNKVSAYLKYSLSSSVLSRLLRLPFRYFEHREAGDILSRFASLTFIQSTVQETIPKLFISTSLCLFSISILCYNSPQLAAISLAFSVLLTCLKAGLNLKKQKVLYRLQHSISKMTANMLDALRAYKAIKLFELEDVRHDSWCVSYEEVLDSHIQSDGIEVLGRNSSRLISAIDHLVVIFVGASLVISGSITVGVLMALISFKVLFSSAFSELVDAIMRLKLLRVNLDRISDIALEKTEDEVRLARRIELLPRTGGHGISGELTVKNLSFRYQGRGQIFKGLSFHVPPGGRVAIVGPSGCGKSTLLSCLTGLLEPNEGIVLLDGVPISRLPEFRECIGTVLQDDVLMAGTIAENISAFCRNADFNKVCDAAQIANIHDEILQMPSGYNTHIGDLGSTFSGGQRQRILIARACYKEPKVFFFDESTNQLDKDTEYRIKMRIASLKRTVVYITHRLETIDEDDIVIRLQRND